MVVNYGRNKNNYTCEMSLRLEQILNTET